MKRTVLFGVLSAMMLCLLIIEVEGQPPPKPDRAAANKAMQNGNFKDAFDSFAALALDPADDPQMAGSDLENAATCLLRLGRTGEIDDFIDKAIAAHPQSASALSGAARFYTHVDHYGAMVAGRFVRGSQRGGQTKYVSCSKRDHVRAIQLLLRAAEAARASHAASELSASYMALADMLCGEDGTFDAWRMQSLTDVTVLPDYEEQNYGGYGALRGAPVEPDGTPVYYRVPKNWEGAKNDGERWRWVLVQAAEADPAQRQAADFRLASFLQSQFGVETLLGYSRLFGRGLAGDENRLAGIYSLRTLGDDETIARLATGIKRFKLPDEFNFIAIYRRIIAEHPENANVAMQALANIYQDRQQYSKAAEFWQRLVDSSTGGENELFKEELAQIIGNWGQFDLAMTQPTGKGATVQFRFRNGNKVSFEAYQIDTRKLLDDIKAYLKSQPARLDPQRINIQDVGGLLLRDNQSQYRGARVAQWSLDLTPKPDHFDRRITVTTPLQKAGAYLLTAKMEGGNESHIVLWVADTAIVKKPLDKGTYLFVADAVTGRPIAKANVEFFGYWQEWRQDPVTRANQTFVHTNDFAEFTDADGQLIARDLDDKYQWIIIATTPEGRLAYLGYTGVWATSYREQEYNQAKAFAITDRPVYRPEQTVKFKVWVGTAQYDNEGKSDFADKDVSVQIMNPRGEKLLEKTYRADEYGGVAGELPLPKDAVLGTYYVTVLNNGRSTFRVEEYKKPEFEVTVQAPGEPVKLGDKFAAKVQAKYYFGAPVTEAKVHYKIMRSDYSVDWYPGDYWDWLYGPGYWWFAGDYPWYPGWTSWGCPRPMQIWWPWRQQPPPELIADAEAPIAKDGTLSIDIDTTMAKELQGDTDHQYEITAEVTDQSRRTIVGQGSVIAARDPFKVYAWVDRGSYSVGDVIHAGFNAQTPDRKPVQGKGDLRLLRVTYDKEFKPVEAEVQRWILPTNDLGVAELQLKASQAGQYRLSYKVTDAKDHTIEGGYLFCVRGEGFDGSAFRFNDLELIQDQRDYAPSDKVSLAVNTNRADTCVLLFIRPSNGVYLPPRLVRLKGKSATEQIDIAKKDMPNFFIEGDTISDGKLFTEVREIAVPPENRVLNVEVTPSAQKYKPGEKATAKVKVTDSAGKPYVGTLAISVYDKALDYISAGTNVSEIKPFFWKWRRTHAPQRETTLDEGSANLTRRGDKDMSPLGMFGRFSADEEEDLMGRAAGGAQFFARASESGRAMDGNMPMPAAPPGAARKGFGGPQQETIAQPTVRVNFADTALWIPSLTTNAQGEATFDLTMPENLTTWKESVWAMGSGTRVGEAATEVVTTKNLILRLQAPRFFVEKDEVILSANVHNYLKTRKSAQAVLEMDGGCLEPMQGALTQTVDVEPNSEKRIDWRVKAIKAGDAVVRMKALTDEESDAMQMSFPVQVHGMLKTESFCGVIRPDKESATFVIRVPAERKPEQSRLEIRWSPTLAGAMVDALPYLADYPYGCTEQTLNRFLPAVITQQTLQRMGLDLKDIQRKRTNLNAQEIGADADRAKQWKRIERNPVFDTNELSDMVKTGVNALTSMQCSDGGWGWFSGSGEQSYPHTTALVVHGLQIARDNDVAIVPGVIERGVEWLKGYQAGELQKLRNAPAKKEPWKESADNLDAFVYMVLVDAKSDSAEMRAFLYRDRNNLAVFAKGMFALALHKLGDAEKRDMLMQNVAQYLVQDDENQTAFLRLPENDYWWCWYGSEVEAEAYYLKLLAATNPKSEAASRLVKYLINNRKHSTYWNSTRDTATCVEAFADYLKASGEDKPDMTVTVLIDGKTAKEVAVNKDNLFTFDNRIITEGEQITTGEHRIELRKKGTGAVYFNAYLTNFTLEDPIAKTGLEIKVNRRYYRLTPVEKTTKAEGSRGQALDQKVEKYARTQLANLAMLKSGDLAEIELEIDSKNDYEYIMFEDMKPAGFEPVDVRSGYDGNDLGAYVEFRDNRVTFFARTLSRGKHSVSYRMRAEIPGKFSALPTVASGMYAPELKANADEIKLQVED